MEHNKLSGVHKIMSEQRRDGIISLMAECRKVTLKEYLKSYGLPVSGTKLQLAIRIFDNTKTFTTTTHMPPAGNVSIGIALYLTEDS